jgi:hypothetical protein
MPKFRIPMKSSLAFAVQILCPPKLAPPCSTFPFHHLPIISPSLIQHSLVGVLERRLHTKPVGHRVPDVRGRVVEGNIHQPQDGAHQGLEPASPQHGHNAGERGEAELQISLIKKIMQIFGSINKIYAN